MPKDRTTPYAHTPHSQTTEERKPNMLLVDEVKVLLLNHKENPEKWTLEYIAAKYDISKDIAGIYFDINIICVNKFMMI